MTIVGFDTFGQNNHVWGAEKVIKRSSSDGNPDCDGYPNYCGSPLTDNNSTNSRPVTFETYYSEPYRTGGASYHNRPFSAFYFRGAHEKEWLDGGQTAKLIDSPHLAYDQSSADANPAVHIQVKPGWRVKVRVAAMRYSSAINDVVDESGVSIVNAAATDNYPNIISHTHAGVYDKVVVILDGNNGDYVSIDLLKHHTDIGQFVIKAGGIKFIGGVVDDSDDNEGAYVKLLGVEHMSIIPVDCVVTVSTWGACLNGKQSRSTTITTPASNGGTACPSDLSEERDCTGVEVYPIDCAVSSWGSWGACNNSTKTRSRTVTTPAEHGGLACPPLIDSTSCGGDDDDDDDHGDNGNGASGLPKWILPVVGVVGVAGVLMVVKKKK